MPAEDEYNIFRILEDKSWLGGKGFEVLNQLLGPHNPEDITEIAEELGVNEQYVEDHYRTFENIGILERNGNDITSYELTAEAKKLSERYDELRFEDLSEQHENNRVEDTGDREILEVLTVNQDNVVLEGGYLWDGKPSEHGIEEGDTLKVRETGGSSGLGNFDEVEIVERLDK